MSTDGLAQAPRLTAKGEARRAHIVDVAAALVFEHGVAEVSVEDVCRAAEVSPSQIYHYFSDRSGLIRAVVELRAASVLAGSGETIFHLDTVDGLRRWADEQVAIAHERRCVGGCELGSLASQLNETMPEARSELTLGFERWEAPIAAGMSRMKERGELPADVDPGALAISILAALQGGLLLTQTERTPRSLQAALDAQVRLVELLRDQAVGAGQQQTSAS
jgi:TetR/AcrR family transcriptional regulator, transcriptional repressor for nem operon